MRRPRRAARYLLLSLTAVVVLSAASCGDDNDNGSASQTDDSSLSTEVGSDTTTTTAATTTTLSEDDQVLAAYRAMWDAYLKAVDPPNPDHAELLATHTGKSLSQARSVILQLKSLGVVARGAVDLHPKLVVRTETAATIEDCIVDHGHKYDATTGNRLDPNDPDTFLNHARTQMVLEDGKWKRESSEQLSEPCTPS